MLGRVRSVSALFVVGLILVNVLMVKVAQAASAEELLSSSSGVEVSPSEKSARIEYFLPTSLTLGVNDVVRWAVSEIETEDTFGNKSTDLLEFELSDNQRTPLTYQLSPFGRKATLDFESDFAGKYKISVTAKIGTVVYTNTQDVILSVNSTRNAMTYSDGQTPSLIYESPDVRQDLNTVVRFKISWKAPTVTGVPNGPHWIWFYTADSEGMYRGKRVSQDLLTGTDWINLPVSYADWRANGGAKVLVSWSLQDAQRRERYIPFQKWFDIPINFPKPTASLETSCDQTFVNKTSRCRVKLNYKDALGISTSGDARIINWQILKAGTVLKAESSPLTQSSESVEVTIPPSSKSLTFIATIAGSDISSQTTAFARDLNLDLQNSLSITKSCPKNFKGNSFNCTFRVNANSPKKLSLKLYIQEKVDAVSWKTYKTIFLKTNTPVTVTLPSNMKSSLSLRAYVIFSGKTIYSSVQDWVVSKPNITPDSDTRITAIRKGLKEGCTRIPSQLDIKYVGPGPSNGGNPSRTYRVNGIFTVAIYDLGNSWNFGAFPIFGENQSTAALWNCGGGGKGAVLRMYFVSK